MGVPGRICLEGPDVNGAPQGGSDGARFVPYLLVKPEAGSTRSEHFVGSTQAARSDRYVGNRAGSGRAPSLQTDKRLL